MMLNDTLGDCTVAAAGHMVEDWTANARGSPVVIPDSAIRAAYNVVDGGVDQGADILTVLNYWRGTGIGGHKITAFAEVSPRVQRELFDAVAIFGGAYIGLALPDFAVRPPDGNLLSVPWTVPTAGVSANPPNPNNGHCVPILGYDSAYLYVVTWGTLKSMSWDFCVAYCDEAYALLSPDWIAPGGESPSGFDRAQLQSDLSSLTRAVGST